MNNGLQGLPEQDISKNAWRVDKAGTVSQVGGITTAGSLSGAGSLFFSGSLLLGTTIGGAKITLPNNNYLGSRNAANGAAVNIIALDNNDRVSIMSAGGIAHMCNGQLTFSDSDFTSAGSAKGMWATSSPNVLALNIGGGSLIFRTSNNNATTAIERMRIDPTGRIGLNTANPRSVLDVSGVIFASSVLVATGNIISTGLISNSLFSNNDLVLGTQYFTGTTGVFGSTTGFTGYVQTTGIVVSGTNTSIYNTLNIGAFSFNTNPGSVTLVELPITSGSGISGVEQSYSLNVGGQSLLKIYAESNGASGIQNTRIVLGTGQTDRVYINAGVNSPSPNSGSLLLPVSETIIGGTDAFLGNPSGWWEVLISGRVAKIPYYF